MNLSLGIISEIISEKAVLHLPDKITFLNQYFEINSVFSNAKPQQGVAIVCPSVISLYCAIDHMHMHRI